MKENDNERKETGRSTLIDGGKIIKLLDIFLIDIFLIKDPKVGFY